MVPALCEPTALLRHGKTRAEGESVAGSSYSNRFRDMSGMSPPLIGHAAVVCTNMSRCRLETHRRIFSGFFKPQTRTQEPAIG